jgi:hypothetical protein
MGLGRAMGLGRVKTPGKRMHGYFGLVGRTKAQKHFIQEKQTQLEMARARGLTDDAASLGRDLRDAGLVLVRLEQERRAATPRGNSYGGGFVGSNF